MKVILNKNIYGLKKFDIIEVIKSGKYHYEYNNGVNKFYIDIDYCYSLEQWRDMRINKILEQ